jgi:L-lactate dehydrogenase
MACIFAKEQIMTMITSTSRIAIVGAGHVGATAAYALMLRALVREIVIIDSDHERAVAEARDITDANTLARPAHIWAGDYAAASTASIAVITAGAATHGSETRLAVAARSAAIVEACTAELSSAGFTGVIVVAANPVDLMTMVAFEMSGLPANRVIGTGTLLDSSRLRAALAQQFAVSPSAVDALVLGEHGDSEVAMFSTARLGGLLLSEFSPSTQEMDRGATAHQVRDAGYEIIAGKGHTSFGIATAIVRICEAILRDEHTVLPVSSRLEGPPGLAGICMSMPCIVGAEGIVRVLTPEMSDAETKGLADSAARLANVFEQLQKDRRN